MRKFHFILTGSAFIVAALTSSLLYLQAETTAEITIELFDTTEKLSSEKIITKTLRKELEVAELDFKEYKENAACLIALNALKGIISDNEINDLVKEIPKGNPFTSKFQVTSSFGESTGFFPRKEHKGIDGIPEDVHLGNKDIMAFASGEVVSFGVDRVHGKNIIIEHSDKVRTRYSHLYKIFYSGTTGKYVTSETKIGIMGNSGFSQNPHLHFEILIKVNDDKWAQINPHPYIEGE